MLDNFTEIIKKRRTVRKFKKDIPDIKMVNSIIESALYAPFGGATGIPLSEIRKVYIFEQNTQKHAELASILQSQLKQNSKKLNTILLIFPFLKKKMKSFAKRVENLSRQGIPALSTTPYIIIIAEKKGFPPIEKQSIAHALQNMWLTSTSLGLGFQLISAFGTLSKNQNFLSLLNVGKNEYEFEGCAIGYPEKISDNIKEFELDKFVTWVK